MRDKRGVVVNDIDATHCSTHPVTVEDRGLDEFDVAWTGLIFPYVEHANGVDADTILDSFAPYYRTTILSEETDPNKLHDLKATLDGYEVYTPEQVDLLVDKLDDNATQNFFIQRTSYSKLDELKRNLKIQAVQAAKEKANYLASAINESVGVAVTINEPNEFYQPYYNTMANRSMTMKNAVMDQESAPDLQQADFKKLKIRYDVTVVFALK